MSEGSEGSALASSVHSRGSAPRAPRAFARFARRKRSVTFEGLRPSSTPRFRSLRSTKALSYVRGAPPLEHPALSLASLDESAQLRSRGSAPRAPRAFARFARRKRSVTFEGLRPSSTPRFRSLRSTKALSYVRGAPPLEHPALSLASLDESAQLRSRGSAPRAPRAFARFARRKRSVTFEGLRPSSTPRFRSLRSTKALSYVRGAPPLELPALSLASLDESAQFGGGGGAASPPVRGSCSGCAVGA